MALSASLKRMGISNFGSIITMCSAGARQQQTSAVRGYSHCCSIQLLAALLSSVSLLVLVQARVLQSVCKKQPRLNSSRWWQEQHGCTSLPGTHTCSNAL